jgi:hypothetical protein
VIGLQTAFGGGKTHTMLAIFHLAKHLAEGGDPRALPGLGQVLEKANIAALPKPKLAVFVGSADGPDVSLKLDKGPRVHTVWGYLAWRLAGDKGLTIVAEAEKARTSPGSRAMVELFKLAGRAFAVIFGKIVGDDISKNIFEHLWAVPSRSVLRLFAVERHEQDAVCRRVFDQRAQIVLNGLVQCVMVIHPDHPGAAFDQRVDEQARKNVVRESFNYARGRKRRIVYGASIADRIGLDGLQLRRQRRAFLYCASATISIKRSVVTVRFSRLELA